MASTALLGSGIALLKASDLQLPSLSVGFAPSFALVGAIFILTGVAVAFSEARQDRLVVELHNGRLYIQWNVPPRDAPVIVDGAVEVSSGACTGLSENNNCVQASHVRNLMLHSQLRVKQHISSPAAT